MLGNAARFARGNVGFADGVEQRSLAVIDVAHDRDHGRARHFELVGVLGFEHFFDGLVGQLFFVADDGGRRAELGGHILHHLGIERLVHGDEDAAHQQRRDQVLGADFELLRQVLHADAFGDGDLAGDGQRLVAVLHAAIAWRRHKALHRAFFGLRILLLATSAAARRGALRASRLLRRRCAASAWARAKAGASAKSGTCAKTGPCAGSRLVRRARESARGGARGMLGPRAAGELTGSVHRPPGGALSRTAGPLAGLRSKIGLPRCNPRRCQCRCGSRRRSNDRRLVDRPRPGLRHHHAARQAAQPAWRLLARSWQRWTRRQSSERSSGDCGDGCRNFSGERRFRCSGALNRSSCWQPEAWLQQPCARRLLCDSEAFLRAQAAPRAA